MLNSLKLYFRYIDLSLRGQMQYRASFIMRSTAQFLVTSMEFLALMALFQRFGQVRDWKMPEVAMLYGMISIAFAIAEAVARGFDVFPPLIRMGDFDRFLLRPRSTELQILGQELKPRLGRLIQGAIVLGFAFSTLSLKWTIAKVLLLICSILGGVCLFSGLFIIQAAMCFWTIESIEIVNCTTYGGVQAGQLPMSIYKPGMRIFFTYVVPIASVNYLPARIILGRSDALPAWLAPMGGVVFLVAALRIFQAGVRHYRSTGS